MGPRAYGAALQRASLTPEPAGVDARELNAFIRSDETARGARSPSMRSGAATRPKNPPAPGCAQLATTAPDACGRASIAPWPPIARPSPRPAASTPTRYPMPVLEPEGGFTIEKALVYAIARKETDFNASARSGAGAYGMMQVMPTTAAHMTGDQGYVRNPERLYVPATNLKLGSGLCEPPVPDRVLPGRPAEGRGLLQRRAGDRCWRRCAKLGPDADPLLLIETIDVPQAREYVEKVVAAYWIYQRMLGAPLKTLDAVASGAKAVPIRLDYVAPAAGRARCRWPEAAPVAGTPLELDQTTLDSSMAQTKGEGQSRQEIAPRCPAPVGIPADRPHRPSPTARRREARL